jgi:hypothetical protein
MRFAFAVPLALAAVVIASAQAPSPRAPSAGAPGAVAPSPAGSSASNAAKTGSIRGRVLRVDTGQPVPRARVEVGSAAVALTGDDGRFEFARLPVGRYTLTAAASGLMTQRYGERRWGDGGRAIEIADGDVVSGIDIVIQRGGAIAGTITDEHGEPLVAAPVWVMQRRYQDGERRLVAFPDSFTYSNIDLTDDQGQFRLYGLPAGAYYVAAGPSNPDARSRIDARDTNDHHAPPTLFPGTRSETAAQPLTIAAGEEIDGVTFAVVLAKTSTIRGVVQASGEKPAGTISLVLPSELGGVESAGRVRSDGTFAIANLSPATYTVVVRDGDQAAVTPVTVNGADVTVGVRLTRGAVISGRLVFDGASTPSRMPVNLRVTMRSTLAASLNAQAAIDANGVFRATGLFGSQFLDVSVGDGWSLNAIERGGSDITSVPIDVSAGDVGGVEITLTRQVTSLTGDVRDAQGRPADATVVLFAQESEKRGPRNRYTRVVRADQNGHFSVRQLLPANYVAIAVDALERGEETNPGLLEQWARTGTAITLRAGDEKAIQLQVVNVP